MTVKNLVKQEKKANSPVNARVTSNEYMRNSPVARRTDSIPNFSSNHKILDKILFPNLKKISPTELIRTRSAIQPMLSQVNVIL